MFSSTMRSQFLAITKRLRIVTDYSALLLLYKILNAICLACPILTPDKVCNFILSKPFQSSLAKYSPALLGGAFSNLQQISDIIALCKIFRANSFEANPVDFFLNIAPGIVADWSQLNALGFSNDQLINLLFCVHTAVANIIGTPAVFGVDSSILDSCIRPAFPHLSSEEIDIIWEAVCYSSCKASNIQSHVLQKAITAYSNFGKSKEYLLADYLLEFQDPGQTPICFNSLNQNERNQITARKMPSEESLSFYNASKFLHKELPSRVLGELLYNTQHDTAVECSLLANRFLARVNKSEGPLLINPSPRLLNKIATQLSKEIKQSNAGRGQNEKGEIAKQVSLSVIVPNRPIALALASEFPEMSFYSLAEAISNPINSDLIMLCCPKGGKKNTAVETLLNCFTISENCECVIYVPEYLLLGKNASLNSELEKKNLQLSQIIEAPPGMIPTKSKKKLMLIARPVPESETNNNTIIPIYKCETTAGNDYVLIRPEAMYISIFDLLRKTTVKQALSELSSLPVSKRNRPAVLSWSTEINIAYTTFDGSTEKSHYLRTKAYIVKMDRIDSTKAGHAIAGTHTEQGLRSKNEAELIEKLMKLPLRENLQQIIVDEVVRVYGHQPEVLTIKTIWLCLRKKLQRKGYEDKLAQDLFCGPDQSLSNLYFSASYEEFEKSFHNVLGCDHIPIKYWTVLRQIAEAGIKYGFFPENPLDKYAPIIEVQARNKVYSIQEAIRKWTFSPAEMDRMINPLILLDESSVGNVRPYASDSHTLLKLVACFSLATKAELIALNHNDIIDLPNGGIQALIVKFVDNNGELVEYDCFTAERRKRRKVVFPPFIAACYRERVEFLKDKTKSKEIRAMAIPIFLGKEDVRHLLSPKNRCPLNVANKLYRELVDSANASDYHLTVLEGKEAKVIDLGLPRKTENLFRNQIIITGSQYGLTDGELSYAAGIIPEATIDAHYIGFDVPQNQIATSAKLHRLSAKYYGRIDNRKALATLQRQHISETKHKVLLKTRVDRRTSGLLELIPSDPAHPSAYQITIQSSFDHKVTVSSFS